MIDPFKRTFGLRLAHGFGRVLAVGAVLSVGAALLVPAPANAQSLLDNLKKPKAEEKAEPEKQEDKGPYDGVDAKIFQSLNRNDMTALQNFKANFPKSPLIGRVNGEIKRLEDKAKADERAAEASRVAKCASDWAGLKSSCSASAVQSFASRCEGTEQGYYALQRVVGITGKVYPECKQDAPKKQETETVNKPEPEKPEVKEAEKPVENKPAEVRVTKINPTTRWAERQVNVRDAPNTQTGRRLGGLRADQKVTMVGRVPGGPWVQIRFNRGLAYVHGGFLTDKDPGKRTVEEEKPKELQQVSIRANRRTMYAKQRVNVRDYPNTSDGRVIGSLRSGQSVRSNGTVRNSSWMEVVYNGRKAYVIGSALTSTKPTEETRREPEKKEEKKEQPQTTSGVNCGGRRVASNKVQMGLGSGLVFPYYSTNGGCSRQGSVRPGRRFFYQIISSSRSCGKYRVVRVRMCDSGRTYWIRRNSGGLIGEPG